ncbi:MAG: helix-turn-helix transcriptional regulator [Clostridiales bacterium]|nr:helix-turn-helix transcriptional regulator [Clostridiales bacterium]
MKDFYLIQRLVGSGIEEDDLRFVDCYVEKKLGLFIPVTGPCGYASQNNHMHPSYMIVICFPDGENQGDQFPAYILSPGKSHNDAATGQYYCLMIDRAFFESQYLLYEDEVPVFETRSFKICRDILKTLNTFAFEYSKGMKNSDITLAAQATVITHWIIRSVLGETLDVRAISSDYSVARAQQYIEKHYAEPITVADLARLGYMSGSSLNRRFRSEIGKSPIQYLIWVRVERAKLLLRRHEISMTEIALRCGFSSGTHFSSCFAKNEGISPTDYQAKYVD